MKLITIKKILKLLIIR